MQISKFPIKAHVTCIYNSEKVLKHTSFMSSLEILFQLPVLCKATRNSDEAPGIYVIAKLLICLGATSSDSHREGRKEGNFYSSRNLGSSLTLIFTEASHENTHSAVWAGSSVCSSILSLVFFIGFAIKWMEILFLLCSQIASTEEELVFRSQAKLRVIWIQILPLTRIS